MLRHIVLIKTDCPHEVDRLVAAVPGFIGRVPGLLQVEVGRDRTGLTRGYDRGFVMTFDGPDGLAAWDVHPDHDPIRSALMAVSEMIVFDYEV
ncbi:Dabb family protein [Kitasatospora sp. NBC_01560]|uniref:Dabb family protein n=1 Tax=Kitasatospora sp. NBC_01560 TaxID=2975965 RepID=UPI00386ACD41